MAGPMSGIRVIDLGSMIAGPSATTVLADQGADVIKVEPPGIGDYMRHLGANRNGVSSLFHSCNRGKRSLALNLKRPEAVDVLKSLIKTADVLVENYRPGVTARLGVDYPALSELNPDLIYLSVCGFGHNGPMADRPAYDNVIQTFAGVARSQADGDSGEPRLYQQLFSDKVTALTGSQAVSAALFARERGRGGQHIELSMLNSVVTFLWPDMAGTDAFLEEGAMEGLSVAKGIRLLKFRDGYGTASPVTDAQFHGYCRAFGIDSSDPGLATVADRNRNIELIVTILKQVEERSAQMGCDEAIAALEAEDVPCAAALELSQLPEHPQVQAAGVFQEFEHPLGGTMREPGNPPAYSATCNDALRPAPELGQHSRDILNELGIDEHSVAQLFELGAVG